MYKSILAGTAIAGIAFFSMANANAEVTSGQSLQNMIPPVVATDTAANTQVEIDSNIWTEVPAAEVKRNDFTTKEGQEFVPIEEDTAAIDMPRSGFDDPINADDFNAIETAAGATRTLGGMDSSLGFEDPAVYSEADDGSDLVGIMPAAGGDDMHEAVEAETEAYVDEAVEVEQDMTEEADTEVNAVVDTMTDHDEMGGEGDVEVYTDTAVEGDADAAMGETETEAEVQVDVEAGADTNEEAPVSSEDDPAVWEGIER